MEEAVGNQRIPVDDIRVEEADISDEEYAATSTSQREFQAKLRRRKAQRDNQR